LIPNTETLHQESSRKKSSDQTGFTERRKLPAIYRRPSEMKSDTDLYRNEIGLYEPADGNVIAANELDIVITPLVAFDNRLNRVGMGGGCFDRSFAFLKHRKIFYRPKLVGVAFECQRVEKVNANPWDIRLFQIITDLS
jgi:5-formyltetrahydrofolate cyclo-ligase